MFKERPAVKVLDGIFISAACLSTFLYAFSYWFIVLTVVLAVTAFILPGLYASGIAGSRLKVCSYGTTILSVFPYTLLVVIPVFVASLFFNEVRDNRHSQYIFLDRHHPCLSDIETDWHQQAPDRYLLRHDPGGKSGRAVMDRKGVGKGSP